MKIPAEEGLLDIILRSGQLKGTAALIWSVSGRSDYKKEITFWSSCPWYSHSGSVSARNMQK
jgi:hypothetical protein